MTLHIALACLSIQLAGCFNPRPAAGVMCGAAGQCPPGLACGLDGTCHANDSPPDAPPVACMRNDDCHAPLDRCSTEGTCNLNTYTCDFGAVDCSSMNSECNLGACEPSTGACVARPRNEGLTCGSGTACGPFGPCDDFSSVCDSSGTQTRACTDYTCRAGACTASSRDEPASCVRSTNGTECDKPTETSCGACGFSDTCDNTGTHSCTCTSSVCQNEVCTPTSRLCTTGCTRNTDDTRCAEPTTTCNACAFPAACAETAPPASCICSAFACQSGRCARQDTSCTEPCSRSTKGKRCGCEECGFVGQPLLCSGGACSDRGVCGDC